MAVGTISQRITLDGAEDIRRKLLEIGKAGEQAFRQIQDAAKKPVVDQAQLNQAATAIQNLSRSMQQFGAASAEAGQQTAKGLDQANQAAQQTQSTFGNLATSANVMRVAVVGLAASIIGMVNSLSKGAAETASTISDQADKLRITTAAWIELRKAISTTTLETDDFIKAAGTVQKLLDVTAGGAIKFGDSLITLSKFGDNVVSVFGGSGKVNEQLSKFVDEVVKAGVPLNNLLQAIGSGKGTEVLKVIAQTIANLNDESKKAALGAKFFGDKWKEAVEALTASKEAIDASTGAIRELSAEQVKRGNEVKLAWDQVSEAFKALKDRIGAIFFSTTLPDWLVKLLDGTNKLFQQWVKLDDFAKGEFLKGLGDSPAEFLFKTLLDIGKQLAALWNQVLVPAGRALANLFVQITGQIEGVTGSQTTAFFVTLTVAVVALTGALRILGLVLAPLGLLFSGFGPIVLAAGAVAFAFWDQIVAGAQQAAALIPNSLDLIKSAIANLFAGNFAKAWAQFSEAAVAAFQTLAQAAQQNQGVIGQVFGAIQQVLKDLPGAIVFVAQAFLGLGKVMSGVADTINAIFGTKLTGTDIALLAIVIQLVGAFGALAAIVSIVGTALGVLFGAFGALAAVVSGPLLAAIIAVGVALATLVTLWPEIQRVFLGMAQAIVDGWNGLLSAFQTGIDTITGLFATAWGAIVSGWNTTVDAIMGGINTVIGGIQTMIGWLQSAWEWLNKVGTGGGDVVPNPAAPGAFARGGFVSGPGSATSDSILARLSSGEFVMNARAVKHFGANFFAALNALQTPRGFATGGFVRGLPAFAGGGMVSRDLGTLTLNLGGQSVRVLASPSAVEQLSRFATVSGQRRAGRPPGWA